MNEDTEVKIKEYIELKRFALNFGLVPWLIQTTLLALILYKLW